MPRPAGGVRTADAIQEAAAELFYQHGYEATTLRQVAQKVGIQVGSLYNHISGKEDLLRSLMTGIMADLLAAQKAVANSHADVIDALRAAIDCHIRFHAQRAREVFIGNSELRSLSKKDRNKVVSQRDDYEQMFRDLIERADQEGRADVLDPRLQAYAIVAMGTHVASWYRPKGAMSLDEIVETYTVMALRQLGVAESEIREARAAS
ncbi:TetR/AcrR family transcriptional regulator [Saccharopolyspora erythraea]|uniref:TetR/AcrR family transcriptional regulator n=1 Tax=Saccharopolyspora erythraea TaxID=1836 RepID=UPI001BA95D74|nr:TetR/AcrR family transcriptional regulator [Saccharopolyspora erythraea]QUH01807.1 TetR/AcrR family transcriptional regulator [Saccharopolyspora erythraea]